MNAMPISRFLCYCTGVRLGGGGRLQEAINGTVDEPLIFKYGADVITGLKGRASGKRGEASEEGVRKQKYAVKELNDLSGPTTKFLIPARADLETDVWSYTMEIR